MDAGTHKQFLATVQCKHRRIFGWVEVIACFFRWCSRIRIFLRIAKGMHDLQSLQKGDDIADLNNIEQAVRTPWRHDRAGVEGARIVDVIEQPFIAARNANQREVGADITRLRWRVFAHDMACHATATACAVKRQLPAFCRIAFDWSNEMDGAVARRSSESGEGVKAGPVGLRPAGALRVDFLPLP